MHTSETNKMLPSRLRAFFTIAAIVVLLTIGGLLCLNSCAPKSASGNDGKTDDSKSGITVAWSADMECTSCHAKEGESAKDSNCLASVHTEATCEDCHGKADSLSDIHANASASSEMPTKLSKKNAVEEKTCLQCHGSWDELAQKTTAVTTLTDSQGTVVNPHAIDRSGDHQVLTCSNCHTIHAEEDDQKQLCLSCHHEDVFECHTCHE